METVTPTPGALPQPLTSFVGRERELVEVGALVVRDDVRLVTLTGPGGVGKTRLAIEVARVLAQAFDQVRFVPLETIDDAELVGPAIAAALGGQPATSRSSLTGIVAPLLGERSALLVLDNLEQVVDVGPALVELLAHCPALTMLGTSRIGLRLSGERRYVVPSLAVDRPGAAAPALLVARAAGAGFHGALADTDPVVLDICRVLDGLPLAIELAAPKLAILSPQELRDRLVRGLTVLRHDWRDQPDRLRSVRASIAWSHGLLDPAERDAFAQFGVLAGGWSLDAAEAVVRPAGGRTVLEVLEALVAASLVQTVPQAAGGTRYRMLETVREFAAEQLGARPDADRIRARHAGWALGVAEAAEWCWFADRRTGHRHLACIQAEEANIRAALEYYRRVGDMTSLLRMAGRLGGLWVVSGRTREGRHWLEAGLAAADLVPPAVVANARAVLSWVINTSGDPVAAVALAEAALPALCAHAGPLEIARGHILAGVPARRLGRSAQAIRRLDEAAALLAEVDAPGWVPNALVNVFAEAGLVALAQGDIPGARQRFRAARQLQHDHGHATGASHVYGHAVPLGMAHLARSDGDLAEALRLYQQALALGAADGNARATVLGVGGIAGTLAAAGDHARAARLFGAAEAMHRVHAFDFRAETFDLQRALGLPEPWLAAGASFGGWQALREVVHAARRGPPPIPEPDAVEEHWAQGRALLPETVVTEALAATLPAVASAPPLPVGLSEREVEVLRLLATGATDPEIAAALYISRRTVASHVAHIYDKLGVGSRAEAAAMAVRHGVVC